MSQAVQIAIVAILTVAASIIVMWRAHRYARHGKVVLDLMEAHYRAAQKLLKDDSVPESVADFVVFFASGVGKPALARRFVWLLVKSRFVAMPTLRPHAQKFADDLPRLSDSQKQIFAEMVVSGMMASAVSAPFLEPLYLSAFTHFVSKNGRKGSIDPSVERVETVALDLGATSPEFACA